MIREGQKAPDFKLVGDDGKQHTLKEFAGKTLVLYFYPRDDTPGCTIEAKDFTKELSAIRKLGADVVGVSDDPFESHCKFRDKYGLKVLLLSDPKHETIEAYDSWGDRGVFGVGTIRKTYIIDGKGIVAKNLGKVNPVGHAENVVALLKEMKGK